MIAIYGKTLNEKNVPAAQELFDLLKQRGMKCVVEEKYARLLYEQLSVPLQTDTFANFCEVENCVDEVLSLGGDGTILDAVVMIKESEKPILGINFGRLGFLASLGKEQIVAAVDAIESGAYMIDKRSLIELQSNKPLFEDNIALNDMTIQRQNQSSMITVNAYLNGELLNTYWADGLIVATPTGSTGYSLSCQGPIVFPDSRSFVITPIAPHNLNVRPIVVPDTNVISFEIESRSEEVICSLDARREVISKDIQLAVRKESFDLGLLRLSEDNFLQTLRNKLTWGLDKRN